jgi:hypothetical protein
VYPKSLENLAVGIKKNLQPVLSTADSKKSESNELTAAT